MLFQRATLFDINFVADLVNCSYYLIESTSLNMVFLEFIKILINVRMLKNSGIEFFHISISKLIFLEIILQSFEIDWRRDQF